MVLWPNDTLKLIKVYMVPFADDSKWTKKSQGKDFFEFLWNLHKSAQCLSSLYY